MAIDDFGAWRGIAAKADLNGVASSIQTGCDVAHSAHDEWLEDAAAEFEDGIVVLDLGCGIGRNLVWLARTLPEITVVGYDAPEMVARVGEYCRAKYGEPLPGNVELIAAPDWETVAAGTYDVVVVSLVFQHLPPAAIAEYVADLKQIADTIVVYGRRANDCSQKTTWGLLEECCLHPSTARSDREDGPSYAPRGDSNDHHICVYKIR